MTGALPVAVVLGNGAAVPGAYLAVGIVLLLFSVGYATMSQRVTNTGAFFAYVGRGLGIGPGVGSAYASLVAYLAIQLAIFGFFGAVMRSQMDAELGITLPWWAWSLIAWGIVLALSAFSVDVGAKVLGVLMLIELASLVLVSLAVFIQGGPEGVNWGASFAPDKIFVGGITGASGIALAFAFASFIGFEATAIYGEESKDPKRSVPIATYLAVTIITLLFALTTFAVVTALGAEPRGRGVGQALLGRGRAAGRLGPGDLLRRAGVRRRLAGHVDELAGAEQPVRRPARLPELRRPLLLLDGPRGGAASSARPGEQGRRAADRLDRHLGDHRLS